MSKREGVVVLGAGGHAKVVVSTLRAQGHGVATILDDNPHLWGQQVLGVTIRGPLSLLRSERFVSGVIAVGDNATRQRLAQAFQVPWLTVIHPAAVVDPSARLGTGTVIMAGAVVQADAVIGDHAIVNTAATVDHGCTLGDFVHCAPGVHLAGDVFIGEGALMGVGSTAIPSVRIGSWVTVGAGSVVIENLPDGVLAVGAPARVRRAGLADNRAVA
jgi:sugar O-acyltransferase (sialic acid O-acetyltransferase NeuD family)